MGVKDQDYHPEELYALQTHPAKCCQEEEMQQPCYHCTANPVLGTRDACEEDKEGDEEADAEVQVDGGSGALDGADQRERQDADEQANK